MRTVKKVHQAVNAPMGNLKTYRAMPTNSINHLDPFLFLNHHGPQFYPPNNEGLPFGPHPHRGFETLTFIISGDITHWDSSGGKSVINAGGIQWMTAGSGVIHSEISSDDFLEKGGEEEVLQLWLNLPSSLKMTTPSYTGLQAHEIPKIEEQGYTVHLISGNWKETRGPINSLTKLMMSRIDFNAGSKMEYEIKTSKNIFFYVVRGKVNVNGATASMYQLVEFDHDDELLIIEAQEDSIILFGQGTPFNEPIVAHGPFVMNSEAEIQQAFIDYQKGKMGTWKGFI